MKRTNGVKKNSPTAILSHVETPRHVRGHDLSTTSTTGHPVFQALVGTGKVGKGDRSDSVVHKDCTSSYHALFFSLRPFPATPGLQSVFLVFPTRTVKTENASRVLLVLQLVDRKKKTKGKKKKVSFNKSVCGCLPILSFRDCLCYERLKMVI